MTEPERPSVTDLTRDEAIGRAFLETDHLPGMARKAPAFVERLEEAGFTVVPHDATEPAGPLDVERLLDAADALGITYDDRLLGKGPLSDALAAEYARLSPGAPREDERLREVRRLLGYLWTATGTNHLRPVSTLFDEDDPLVADVERLAIFDEAPEPSR
jgi:hypothetical protein